MYDNGHKLKCNTKETFVRSKEDVIRRQFEPEMERVNRVTGYRVTESAILSGSGRVGPRVSQRNDIHINVYK
jgi:hypothetical protein